MITWRSFQLRDLDALVDLITTAETERGSQFQPTPAELKGFLAAVADFLLQNATGAWDGERLVAACSILPDPWSNRPMAQFQGVVDPRYIRQGLGDKLFAYALERRQTLGGLGLRLQSEGENPGLTVLCQRHGFEPERFFFRMCKDDVAAARPPEVPVGYRLTYAGPQRLQEARAAVKREFAGQWSANSPEMNDLMFERSLAAGQVHPENWLVLDDAAGQIVATCFTNTGRTEQDQDRGFIYTLGVVPAEQGKGLGRLMLQAGVHALQQKDCRTAYLDVDSANPSPALGLYERQGFRTTHTRTFWRV